MKYLPLIITHVIRESRKISRLMFLKHEYTTQNKAKKKIVQIHQQMNESFRFLFHMNSRQLRNQYSTHRGNSHTKELRHSDCC